MPAARAAALQGLISQRFPDAVPAPGWSRGVVSSGVDALDRILPSGGFQRGRLAAWLPGAGAAALLRSAALHAVIDGERVVWIDASGTIAGDRWRRGPLLIRPRTPLAGLRACEELARSGGFAFVVVDGADADSAAAVRCARAAHEGGAAVVLLARQVPVASLRLESRALPQAYGWRKSRLGEPGAVHSVRVRTTARASGWHASAELVIPVWHEALRSAVEFGLADRRTGGRTDGRTDRRTGGQTDGRTGGRADSGGGRQNPARGGQPAQCD
jgi:hypothetical protein